MNTNNFSNLYYLSSLFVFAGLAACVAEAPLNTATASEELAPANRLDTVAELVAQRGTGAALADQPAELAYQRVVEAQANRRPATELGIYLLASPEEATSRVSARARGLSLSWTPAQRVAGDEENVLGGPFVRKDSTRIIGLYAGTAWALEYNNKSGGERFFSRDSFHVGNGPIVQPDMNAYRAAADGFLGTLRAGNNLHLYKTRRYLNAVDSDTTAETQEIYQVAVAYGTDIDGVPVIGPGGKVSVHLANGMVPVSYESTVRPISSTRGRTTALALLPAGDAEAQAWARLTADGLDSTTHELRSKQFGYFRRGKSSTQSILAPAYAFMFQPLREGAKKRIEVVSAVVEPAMRALIDADEQTERSRKTIADEGDVRPR